ncbi:hypothetical protein [Maridesulfovibrio hydrothermalis]|uniref:Uncharacterized protein n=1 Tax=Maridesulfovibrio hydrothermalis AM13 = DSM 14728 TaxID=1121451 RepID=L0RCF3_9BACT|nr:hypothetical protein [Maridesulfovibrio hydrothermalis]CCO24448.1 conserved protein of unknown function [Maridesulfovibrio hydrothermalis AM13 = DSM 14728]
MDLVIDIDVPCIAEGVGLGKLTIKHPSGSCGQPVFVAESSTEGYGPAEVSAIQPIHGHTYTEDQLEYVRYHGLQIHGARAWYMENWAPSNHKCEGH